MLRPGEIPACFTWNGLAEVCDDLVSTGFFHPVPCHGDPGALAHLLVGGAFATAVDGGFHLVEAVVGQDGVDVGAWDEGVIVGQRLKLAVCSRPCDVLGLGRHRVCDHHTTIITR